MTSAVTALGTRLYGRYGEGRGLEKRALNHVKKDADAISAYAMSESLWYATRHLPENHAIMVSLGEGLMPKAGETPEMGSNPQLGFGRVYARPQVAQWIDDRVARLLNDPDYDFERFYDESLSAGITIWGAAIDTLENTSRFATGEPTGPLTVLHLFDQPLRVARPYEGYIGNLYIPKEIVDHAAERAMLIDYRTHRGKIVEAIELTYPGIRRENIHVWTLSGPSREKRLGTMWAQWREAGAHLVEAGFELPSGMAAFVDSGSYAPTYQVGARKDKDGQWHVFVCDGYSGSAEAMQAASLAPVMGLEASLSVFTSKFLLPWHQELSVMQIDPEAAGVRGQAGPAVGGRPRCRGHRGLPRGDTRGGEMPGFRSTDPWFAPTTSFPSAAGGCLPRAVTCVPIPIRARPKWRRWAIRPTRSRSRSRPARAAKRSSSPFATSRPTIALGSSSTPLLTRFLAGEDFRSRPVRISDSGRIRNELQTLCSEALDYEGSTIRVHFGRDPRGRHSCRSA